MKRTIVGAALGLVLALTACSGSAPAADSGPAPNELKAPAGTVPLEGAESGAPPAETETGPEEGEAETGAAPSPAPVDPLADLDLNDHGNLPAEVGEMGVLGAPAGETFAELEAAEIEAGFTCPADTAQPSINGQFVAIRFSVKAHPELPESGWPYFAMSVHDFRAWDGDGEQVVDPVGNSAGCVDEADLLPSPVDPGGDAEGLIILDVPEGNGSASFRMGGFEGAYGWEWAW